MYVIVFPGVGALLTLCWIKLRLSKTTASSWSYSIKFAVVLVCHYAVIVGGGTKYDIANAERHVSAATTPSRNAGTFTTSDQTSDVGETTESCGSAKDHFGQTFAEVESDATSSEETTERSPTRMSTKEARVEIPAETWANGEKTTRSRQKKTATTDEKIIPALICLCLMTLSVMCLVYGICSQ